MSRIKEFIGTGFMFRIVSLVESESMSFSVFTIKRKLKEILSDATKFTIINKNPIKKIETHCEKLINEMKLQKKAKTRENCNLPHMYGHPKIHKPETPLRPIVSCIGSTQRPIAKHLEICYRVTPHKI